MTNKVIGKYGEKIAKDFLIKNGFKILETNFRFSRVSEIDIIASKNNFLHFVEVKTRTSLSFGAPLEAINKAKLKQIYSCALFYMNNSKKKYDGYKIDAIGIVVKNNELLKLDFLENISL